MPPIRRPAQPIRPCCLFHPPSIVAAGEAVLRLGTRMAITDHQGGEGDEGDEEQEVDADAQPWSVRLAGLLLVMVQQGDACPWQPYLNVGIGEERGKGGTPAVHVSRSVPGAARAMQGLAVSAGLAGWLAAGAAPDRALAADHLQLGGCGGDRGGSRACFSNYVGCDWCGLPRSAGWAPKKPLAIPSHFGDTFLYHSKQCGTSMLLCGTCSTSPCGASWTMPAGWRCRPASRAAASAGSSGTGRCR